MLRVQVGFLVFVVLQPRPRCNKMPDMCPHTDRCLRLCVSVLLKIIDAVDGDKNRQACICMI